MGFKIQKMRAFIINDSEGNEGVPAIPIGHVHMPLIAADQARQEVLEQAAQQVADSTGMRVEVVEFTVRSHRKWIEPRNQAQA